MAVVTKYGSGYPTPGGLTVSAVFAEATVRQIASKADLANGDSIASKFFLGRVASNAIISPESLLYHTAIAGATMDIQLGPNGTVIAAALALTPAGSKSPLAAIAPGAYARMAWQLAALPADPGGLLDVVGVLAAAATGAGSVELFLRFAK